MDYPQPSDVQKQINDAIVACLDNNIIGALEDILEPILGEQKGVFNGSIKYRGDISDADLLVKQYVGMMPIQQICGRILHDDTIIRLWKGERCVVTEALMNTTFVRRGDDHLKLILITVNDSATVDYVSNLDCAYNIELNTMPEDRLGIELQIPVSGTNADHYFQFLQRLPAILDVYYTLLTRFPTCQISSINFPDFLNS